MWITSIRGRLVLGAVVWIGLGITVSSLALTSLFRDTVDRQFDHDAFDHSTELAKLVTQDGNCPDVPAKWRLTDARFVPLNSGAYWEIRCANGQALRSQSLGNATLPLSIDAMGKSTTMVSVVSGPSGQMRLLQRLVGSGIIGVGLDERLVDNALVEFSQTLRMSLFLVALGLVAAAIAQVTFASRPLERIRRALNAIRAGETDRMPADLPDEVAPLASDLNALIKANEEIMRGARARAGNLAHALKNPLAILVDEGSRLRDRGDPAAADVIEEQCRRMRRQIDYEMARGRAASYGVPRSVAEVGPVVRTIVAAVSRIYQNRHLTYAVSGEETARAACDPLDLSEIVGNLVDNAAKWARSKVSVSIQPLAREVLIQVEDDGPGIPVGSREAVFELGTRLDEGVPGNGLGLAVARDLVAAHRGRISIGDSALGGAAVTVGLAAPHVAD